MRGRGRSANLHKCLRFIGGLLAAVAILFFFGSIGEAIADPGAVSFALGGLQFRKEPRISMKKEVLSITQDDDDEEGLSFQIAVDYEFQNNTDRDVTIAMAFPLPDDICGAANSPYDIFAEQSNERSEAPFHALVEEQEIGYSTEVRAFRSSKYLPTFSSDLGKDYTGLLKALGVKPEFCSVDAEMADASKHKLAAEGLLRDGTEPNWTVRQKYYWRQTFPAKKTTHVRIEYRPTIGYTDIYLSNGWDKRILQASSSPWRDELFKSCVCPDLEKKLAGEAQQQSDSYLKAVWVNFILVTANYWNGPIGDFTLNVETADPKTPVSFCWNGPIKQPDSTHFVATAHNFSPQRNLHIDFFEIN